MNIGIIQQILISIWRIFQSFGSSNDFMLILKRIPFDYQTSLDWLFLVIWLEKVKEEPLLLLVFLKILLTSVTCIHLIICSILLTLFAFRLTFFTFLAVFFMLIQFSKSDNFLTIFRKFTFYKHLFYKFVRISRQFCYLWIFCITAWTKICDHQKSSQTILAKSLFARKAFQSSLRKTAAKKALNCFKNWFRDILVLYSRSNNWILLVIFAIFHFTLITCMILWIFIYLQTE